MKKLLFILFIVVSVPAFSQNLTTLEYSMGFGTGDMGDFIDKPSFRGFTIRLSETRATQRWRWIRRLDGMFSIVKNLMPSIPRKTCLLAVGSFATKIRFPFVLSRLLLPSGRNSQSICGVRTRNNVLET